MRVCVCVRVCVRERERERERNEKGIKRKLGRKERGTTIIHTSHTDCEVVSKQLSYEPHEICAVGKPISNWFPVFSITWICGGGEGGGGGREGGREREREREKERGRGSEKREIC